jgi:hypothetical protein
LHILLKSLWKTDVSDMVGDDADKQAYSNYCKSLVAKPYVPVYEGKQTNPKPLNNAKSERKTSSRSASSKYGTLDLLTIIEPTINNGSSMLSALSVETDTSIQPSDPAAVSELDPASSSSCSEPSIATPESSRGTKCPAAVLTDTTIPSDSSNDPTPIFPVSTSSQVGSDDTATDMDQDETGFLDDDNGYVPFPCTPTPAPDPIADSIAASEPLTRDVSIPGNSSQEVQQAPRRHSPSTGAGMAALPGIVLGTWR